MTTLRPYKVYMRPQKSLLSELTNLPGIEITVLNIIQSGSTYKTLAHATTSGNLKFYQVLEEMKFKNEILDFKVLNKNKQSVTFILERDYCTFYDYTLGTGRFILFPYVIKKGTRKFFIISEEEPSILLDRLKKYGTVTRMEKVLLTDALKDSYALLMRTDLLSKLTPLQRKILSKAIIKGYFDWPRKYSLSDLSQELGISKATLAEHIRRSESKILKYLLEGGEGFTE
ncbi:helix-turn-helix domain-containing protein [Thermofilum pendens]|uniref:Bacterio-opsin activator, HTH domain protein n=1 Tax=Thermofilum pendens (strain DSM 2475 / Hrk 5) TaxID=368408 RepID=A1S0N6_THEPD|nr:helix-turn-helix domain-containing protein [Thermofilum pendens]ABL79016.1 Bacterio-opsin activator, HTH domain protein [Thermofilum pendens Hrk 5]